MERRGGGSGKLVLLIFIAVWKTTYVVFRSTIQLLVAAIKGVSVLGRHVSKMISDYLHTQIQNYTSSESGGKFNIFCCFSFCFLFVGRFF
jgi:hypothetical protein